MTNFRTAVNDASGETVSVSPGALPDGWRWADEPEVKTYVTEDGATVREGDKVYNYYDMEPGTIGRPAGEDGWFYFHATGKGTNILNGPRICTMAFAKRRGFRGA